MGARSMSRIAPTDYEPVDATPRLSMTPARRARILAKHNGQCSYPDCAITEALELDHQIALFLGGKDAESNIVPLCREHHAAKTRLDQKLIGKVRRLQIKQRPKSEQPKAQPIRSTGFRSRWSQLP